MKYYIYIVGCAMNHSDAERIVSILESLGFAQAKSEAEADLLLAVACSVRQSAVDRIYAKGQKWKNSGATTVLSGCLLPKDKRKLTERFDFIFEINDLLALEEFLYKKFTLDPRLQALNTPKNYFSFAPKYESNFRAYLPIMTGCDNFCSYCAVPYVRGREKSRPQKEIITEMKKLIKAGYKEIILLGQNVNSYHGHLKPNSASLRSSNRVRENSFVELIKEIDKIEGDYRVYFYSNHPKDISNELIKTLSKLKHFPNYLHLPLQSGNNDILKKMNRHYTQEDYLALVAKIKKEIPDIVFTTDIMVGFPGETRNQFEDTKKIMEVVGFDMAFLAQYSPRSETASAKLKDNISKTEKKKREAEIQAVLANSILNINLKLVGKEVRVLIDSQKAKKYYGRTDSYKVVEVKLDPKKNNQTIEIGRFYKAKIIKAEPWKLLATLS